MTLVTGLQDDMVYSLYSSSCVHRAVVDEYCNSRLTLRIDLSPR
jgi:hypothetical protein